MSRGAILLFGCLLAAANLAGGALVLLPRRVRQNARAVRYIVALGAGFMLAAVFVEILPRVFVTWRERFGSSEGAIVPAMAVVLCGYLAVYIFEHLFAAHHGAHVGVERVRTDPARAPSGGAGLRSATVYAALAGLFVHTFFDGVLIATGFIADLRFGLLVFAAVLLHKLPEGATAASIALAGERPLRAALTATAGVSIATLSGVVAVLLLPFDVAAVILYALPFSAGVTLYIVASDLIPEIAHRRERRSFASLAVIGGALLFYLLHEFVTH